MQAKEDNDERMLYERPAITIMDNRNQIDEQQGKQPTFALNVDIFETIKQFYGLGWMPQPLKQQEDYGRRVIFNEGQSWQMLSKIFKARNPNKFCIPGLLDADKPRILGVVESMNNALTANDDSIFCSSTGSFSRNVL